MKDANERVIVINEDGIHEGRMYLVVSSTKNDTVRMDVASTERFFEARQRAYPGLGDELQKWVENELLPCSRKLEAIMNKYEGQAKMKGNIS